MPFVKLFVKLPQKHSQSLWHERHEIVVRSTSSAHIHNRSFPPPPRPLQTSPDLPVTTTSCQERHEFVGTLLVFYYVLDCKEIGFSYLHIRIFHKAFRQAVRKGLTRSACAGYLKQPHAKPYFGLHRSLQASPDPPQ